MDESGSLSRAELYDRIRSQIEHEDELINIRVVWQLLAQLFNQQQEFLLWAVPIAAIFLAGVLASISSYTSIYTIDQLGQAYRNYSGQRDEKDQSTKLFPAIQGPDIVRKWEKPLRSACRCCSF